jgi:ATP-dependent Clp protease ATP-binding subunit ClpA
MFERFTTQGRAVVVLAEDEAKRLGHGYIGTEHLLLGLLGEDGGVAYTVLSGAGLDRERVRAEIARLVPSGTGPLGDEDAEAL